MDDWMTQLNDWQKDQKKPTPKPPVENPRPLVDRLNDMANMFTYGFWGWEYETETRDLLLEAAKAVKTYEDLLIKNSGSVE